MIDNYSIAYLTCCAIGTILNGIGLLLLITYKYAGIDLTQQYILINLCCIDLSLSIFLTIDQTLEVFDVSYTRYRLILNVCISMANTGYYCSTLWLILDRYLHIKLNIKYVIYFSKKKTLIATIILWIFLALSGSLFVVYHFNYVIVIYAVFDLIILLFSSYVYAYALILFKKQRANVRSNQHNRGIFKGLVITFIILAVFAVLVAIPDTIYAIESINSNFTYSDKVFWYTWIVYPVSLWTDALIYILFSPKVRIALRYKLKCLFGNGRNTTERSELYYIKS